MSESLVLLSMEFVTSFFISEQPKIKNDSYTSVEKKSIVKKVKIQLNNATIEKLL